MKEENYLQQIQSVLSLGYIYLILMGISNETLFYNQLGIDILKYSSILDVLISPISKLSGSIGFLFFIVLILLTIFLPFSISKYKDKSWFQKTFKIKSYEDKKEVEKSLSSLLLVMTAIGLFGFFIGSGLGGGYKAAQKIENNEIKYNDKLSLITGEKEDVAILGKNSSYLFYLSKDSKTVKVMPISGTVKSIEEVK